MLRSLNITLILLTSCIIVLAGLITWLTIHPGPSGSEATSAAVPVQEATVPDPSTMDPATYSNYLKVQEGEKLFREYNCVSCHDVMKKKVGPALRGVTTRRKKDWIYQAVTNFGSLLQKQDPEAAELFKQYNMQMPVQDFLTHEEIDKIIYFVEHKDQPLVMH